MRRWIYRLLLLGVLVLLASGGGLLWYANQPMRMADTLYPLDFSIHRGATLTAATQGAGHRPAS